MQETGAGKMITLQHCLGLIKAHDMFDCSCVVFNDGEAFLFVDSGSDAHLSLPLNHCLLQIQKGQFTIKTACYQHVYHLATWELHGPCSTLTLMSKNTSTYKGRLRKKSGELDCFYWLEVVNTSHPYCLFLLSLSPSLTHTAHIVVRGRELP